MRVRALCVAALLAGLALGGANATDDKAAGGKAADNKAADGTADGDKTSGAALYKVVDGTKVDSETYDGFRAWRAASCDRCHGANQEGLVGPSLLERMKTLSKEEFVTVVRDGRLDKGMQSFGNSRIVMENIDHLYAYLKGRSDGAITKAKVSKIE